MADDHNGPVGPAGDLLGFVVMVGVVFLVIKFVLDFMTSFAR